MTALNVLGTPLTCCCNAPVTGFYRDGYCRTGAMDAGRHVICASVTQQFLTYSKQQGNDLISPNPAYGFTGLKPGDRWCLCAMRWRQALEAGVAPPVYLDACHADALNFVTLQQLQEHAISYYQ
jgi:uncharacterized protein